MTDLNKRNSLKTISVATAVGAVAMTNPTSSASKLFLSDLPDELVLADLAVTTRVSSHTNDIEVVITNRGKSSATITSMTPSYTTTPRGQFNFSKLLAKGDLHLTSGQSVVVPIEPRPQFNSNMLNTTRDMSLKESLKKSMSFITDEGTFAVVSV